MNSLRFIGDFEAIPLEYSMAFCASEHTLFAIPTPDGSVGGVSLGQELHIEWEMLSDDILALLNPEGVCNLEWASLARLQPPSARPGRVVAAIWSSFSPGINYVLKLRGSEWRTIFDPNSGWMCVGERVAPSGSHCIGVSRSFLVVISESEIVAVWVHVDTRE